MTREDAALREAVVATARAMNAAGINRGKSGNVSARLRGRDFDGFLVTPSGLPYERTSPADIVAMTLDGDVHGARVPSSEWRFHRDIYRARGDVDAGREYVKAYVDFIHYVEGLHNATQRAGDRHSQGSHDTNKDPAH